MLPPNSRIGQSGHFPAFVPQTPKNPQTFCLDTLTVRFGARSPKAIQVQARQELKELLNSSDKDKAAAFILEQITDPQEQEDLLLSLARSNDTEIYEGLIGAILPVRLSDQSYASALEIAQSLSLIKPELRSHLIKLVLENCKKPRSPSLAFKRFLMDEVTELQKASIENPQYLFAYQQHLSDLQNLILSAFEEDSDPAIQLYAITR